MRIVYIFMIAMHGIVGVGAVVGGLGAVLNPNAPMGISTDALKNGPFHSFLIPGLFLFAVIGVGNVIAGALALKKTSYHEATSAALGGILIAWVVIQCAVLWTINPLHIIFFCVGVAQGSLGLFLIIKNRAFPYNALAGLSIRGSDDKEWGP